MKPKIKVRSDVLIAGFPSDPEKFEYCCPSLKRSPKDQLRSEINKAFHDFNTLVYSTGSILAKSEELLDIDCAGTNGMSGGPIMRKRKLIGVYVGGPPLPGQYQLFLINQLLENNQFSEAYSNLSSLKLKLNTSYLYQDIGYFDLLEQLILQISILDFSLQGETQQNSIHQVGSSIYDTTIQTTSNFFVRTLICQYFNILKSNSKICLI